MVRFSVTYEIVSPESAEQGDTEEAGFISEHVRLRDAIDDVTATRTNACGSGDGAEPSCSDIAAARWITVRNGMEFETGCYESRSLHMPDRVTTASRRRISRLLGVRGMAIEPKPRNSFELVSSETAYGRTVGYPFSIKVF